MAGLSRFKPRRFTSKHHRVQRRVSRGKHLTASHLQTDAARHHDSLYLEPENTPITTRPTITTITPTPHKPPMCTTRIRHSPSCGHTWYATASNPTQSVHREQNLTNSEARTTLPLQTFTEPPHMSQLLRRPTRRSRQHPTLPRPTVLHADLGLPAMRRRRGRPAQETPV